MKTPKAATKTIVIAWTVELPGSFGRPDRLESYACTWKLRGTAEDFDSALDYAAREGYRVFRFPTSERDPLGKARAAVVAEHTAWTTGR
jgi:hypothetical protein